MPDGSVILVEIAAGRITHVEPDGHKTVVAEPGGGPNGLAVGPAGKLYCCNNGGFAWREAFGYLIPHGQADDYGGGRFLAHSNAIVFACLVSERTFGSALSGSAGQAGRA